MDFRPLVCLLSIFGVAFNAAAAAGGQWTQGMDDDAGKAQIAALPRKKSVSVRSVLVYGGELEPCVHAKRVYDFLIPFSDLIRI